MRQHRWPSTAAVLILLVVILAASGCSSKAQTTAASSASATATSDSPTPATSSRPKPASARHSARPRRHKPSVHPAACRAPADVLGGVYHPYRLHILTACQQASGNVIRVRHEQDGDLHLDLMLDAPYGQLVNAVNRSEQGGALVVEFMARDGGHLPAPAVGDHLLITGAWVNDADHGWNEIHPVWSEQIAGGSVYRSGPQYGGSPAGDSSVNAEADCRDPSGHLCAGYGETSSSPSSTSASSSGGASSSAVIPPASHLHAGEFCSLAKEPGYEAAGYTCSPGSDGRERLHSR